MWANYTCGPTVHVLPQYTWAYNTYLVGVVGSQNLWAHNTWAYYTCGPSVHVGQGGPQYMWEYYTCGPLIHVGLQNMCICAYYPNVLYAHMHWGSTCIVGQVKLSITPAGAILIDYDQLGPVTPTIYVL